MDIATILTNPQTYITLLTLTFLEIVLGIDNIIFISLTVNKLPQSQHKSTSRLGLFLALFFRIALLSTLSYLTGATTPFFSTTIGDLTFAPNLRDAILFGGGLFLLYKSIKEIAVKIKAEEEHKSVAKGNVSFWGVIVQIIIIDMVFSFDSILTAVGLSKDLPVMITAVLIAVIVMMLFSGKVNDFIDRYPTLQSLALVFLAMIGFLLVADASLDAIGGINISSHDGAIVNVNEIPKTYVYVALGFSLLVEYINIKIRKVAVNKIEGETE